ncbi:MAG: hypothetical protein GF381_01080, partial [Candidatus Pacebacteria bacterium]|nr:hypothetical protein [Candidatus Paceibacterota bacterium]
MQKARSRLRQNKKKTKHWKLPRVKLEQQGLVGRYLKHLPTFLVGLFFSALTGLILTKVHPESIKHFILPHTYFPFLVSFFLSVLFLASFFSLKVRTG